jgi:hypothetical protein
MQVVQEYISVSSSDNTAELLQPSYCNIFYIHHHHILVYANGMLKNLHCTTVACISSPNSVNRGLKLLSGIIIQHIAFGYDFI